MIDTDKKRCEFTFVLTVGQYENLSMLQKPGLLYKKKKSKYEKEESLGRIM